MLSLLLAIEAVETEYSSEAIKELYDSLTASNERLAIRHPKTVLYAAWNASGDRILTHCLDGKARLWSYDDERIRVKLISEQDKVSKATWDSEGTRVLLEKMGDDRVVLDGDGSPVDGKARPPVSGATGWPPELKSLQEQVERSISESLGNEVPIEYIRGHLQQVSGVFPYFSTRTGKIERVLTVSEDNTGQVLTVGAGGTAFLWNRNGKNVAVLGEEADKVSDASWTKAGDIRVIHPDGSSRIWPGTVEKLLEEAKARKSWQIGIESELREGAPRELTAEERHLYID
jgi:WD40 repeat protein